MTRNPDTSLTIDTHHHRLPDFFWQETENAPAPVGGLAPLRWSKEASISFTEDAGIDVAVVSLSTPGVHTGDSGLPPIRAHVGDDEVLLDDSRRFVERAVAGGVDPKRDAWMGMPLGFVTNVGGLNAATQALEASGAFLTERPGSTAK
jgi:acetyl esterase/lipase